MSKINGGRRRGFRSRHHTPMGKGGKLAVIFVTAALLLFVFAVMLGNYLRSLALPIIEDTTQPPVTNEEVYYANPPAAVIAEGIVFGEGRSASEETEIETDTESGEVFEEDPIRFDAVSVTLRRKDTESGELLLAYNSPISLEYAIDVKSQVSLDEGMDTILREWGERTKICGIFEVDYLNRPEESREVMRAYEIALICELVDAGFDEIMLLGLESDVEEALAFISDVYEQKGRSTVIGIAVSFEFLTSATAREELGRIAKKCGFLGLDLSRVEVPSLMSAETLINDRITRTLDLCREYSLRVILGCGEAPDCSAQTRAAMAAGVKNVMTGFNIKIESE